MTIALSADASGTFGSILVNGVESMRFGQDTSGQPFSFRNKLINGNFDIWQRGTSQSTAGYGSDDRWQNLNTGTTKVHSQQLFPLGQTDVPNDPTYFSRTVVTSVAGASNFCNKFQPIENVRTLSGRAAVLSFYAKADASKNIAVELLQSFGTGGSPSAIVTGIGVTTCALTTVWQKFKVPVNIPSIAGKALGSNNDHYLALSFWFDAGSSLNARTNNLGQQSGTFDIAQVQLEEGSIATPFEQRPVGQELMLCQRYFELGFGLCVPSGAPLSGSFMQWVTAKRVTPTLVVTPIGGSGGVWTASINGFYQTVVHSSADGMNWNASAEL